MDTVITQEHDPEAVESILRDLPEWFGIEEAIGHYVEAARTLDTWLARADGDVVGACTIMRHYDVAAEIHVLGVRRAHHRRGVGTALLDRVESELTADGVRLLQVKTLGESFGSSEYDRTRRFYEACGYLPLEEIEDLWPDHPCLIMVKPLG